jgi:hypothetical protein
MSFWRTDNYIVISSIVVEEAMGSSGGSAGETMLLSSHFVSLSTAALRATVSVVDL